MDLTDPTRALTPTLDGPVLSVLARAGRPLTVGQIAEQAPRGSEIGIRRSVMRLVDQGLVTATQMGRNQVHELNRQHVAAPAAMQLADLRLELWKRLRSALDAWVEKPLYACVFGSAARGDGGTDSDIDLLLVHRPFPDDVQAFPKMPAWVDLVGGIASAIYSSKGAAPSKGITPSTGPELSPPVDPESWQFQVDVLHGTVQKWTGNLLHAVSMSAWQWLGLPTQEPDVHSEIQRDAVVVAGKPIVWPVR
jgi:hypothetical protein